MKIIIISSGLCMRERERGGGGGGRITRVLEIIIMYVEFYFKKQTLSFL